MNNKTISGDLNSEHKNGNNAPSFIEKYARILVVIGVIFGATSGTLGRSIGASSIAIGFWRLSMGMPFFIVPVLLKDRREFTEIIKRPDAANNSKITNLSNQTEHKIGGTVIDGGTGSLATRRDLAWAFIAGLFLFAHFTCWFSAVKMTNIASAAVLGALHPLVVLAVSILLYKKRIGRKPIIGIVVALFGACLTAGLDYSNLTGGHFAGDVTAFFSAIFMGFYFAVGEKVRERVPGRIYLLVLFFSCWLGFFVAMIVTGMPFFGYPAKDYILIALMTLFCQIGAHAVFNLCLGYVDSVYVSTWETGDAAFSTLISMIVIRQVPTLWEIIGCILVVAGLLYYNRSIRTDNIDPNEADDTSRITESSDIDIAG